MFLADVYLFTSTPPTNLTRKSVTLAADWSILEVCLGGVEGYRPVIRRMCPRGVLESIPYKKVRPFGGCSDHFRVNWTISRSYLVSVTIFQ